MKKSNLFPCCLIAIFCIALLSNCSPAIKKVYLLPEKLPPKPESHPIQLFTSGSPECPYEEVGLITSRKRNVFISMESVTESLKKEARKMGGDAVINVRLGDQVMGAYDSDKNIVLDHDPILSGTVVRWLDDNCKK